MKKFLLLVVAALFNQILLYAQKDSLIHFDVQTKRLSDTVYELRAKAMIQPGWHLYGFNPAVEGLETVNFSFDYEKVRPQGNAVFVQKPKVIQDVLFKKVNVFTDSVTVIQKISIGAVIPASLKGKISSSLGKGDAFEQSEEAFAVNLEGGMIATVAPGKIKLASLDILHPVNNCGAVNKKSDSSLWSVFFLGILGGLIALITPCVFPMIPVTVSFFTKRSPDHKQAVRNGILYGFFIFLIYILASLPFHILGNVQPEVFNNISTSSWLNLVFFVIFIVFAISFFGFFEITLPSGIANKADSKSGLTSVGGIFFMALTLAIVSFSCTGPILGSLLVGSLSGGAWQLTAGLSGFGLSLALPFALFAIFPSWLHSLPKSGSWLDTVKKILAFIELALAFKFLSNADLVMHWGLIKRETFFGLWILIGSGLTLYLFGILRLPHDYKGMKISTGRKLIGVFSFLFTLYLLPGVTSTQYANLQLLSGFPPPLHYSIYGKENVREKGLEANVVNDFDKAVQLSKAQHKPILIDFTGWACVNCRKMEENVWTKPEVSKFIRENYILVSLYVDDKEKLPLEQRISYTTKEGNQKEIITIGDKWATFQAENFNQVTQPLYAIVNTSQELLNNPIGYTPDASEYLTWLECGRDAFKKK